MVYSTARGRGVPRGRGQWNSRGHGGSHGGSIGRGPLVVAPQVGHHLEAVATREKAHMGCSQPQHSCTS
jgi:hypothetical protein